MAYTGSRSYNEHKRYNINQAQPGTTPIVTRVPYPAFQSAILYSSDAGWARFQGLSFRVEKRYSNGWTCSATTSCRRARDNGSGEIEANDTAFAWDLNADEGPARYDQRHRAAISGGYELPFGPGKPWLSDGGVAAYVLGGWQVFGIIRLSSGFPYSVTSTNVCQCGSFVPQRVNFAAGREGDAGNISDGTVNRVVRPDGLPRAGATARRAPPARNTVRGPGYERVDFSLIKRFPIDKARVEFRWEVFNLFNHANFGTPDLNISNRDRRHDHVGRRRTQHAVRTAVHLVSSHSRCLRPNQFTHALIGVGIGLALGAVLQFDTGAAPQSSPGQPAPPRRQAVGWPSPSRAPCDFNDHEGYVSLFDGVSLKGWDGNPKFWRVEDGAIVGESTPTNPSGNSYIVYRNLEAKDFTLKFEIKVEGTGGSGLQYRSRTGLPWLVPIPPAVTANVGPVNLDWMMTGPQADFWPSRMYTGQFYSENTPMRILAWRGQVVEGFGAKSKKLMGTIGDRTALGTIVRHERLEPVHGHRPRRHVPSHRQRAADGGDDRRRPGLVQQSVRAASASRSKPRPRCRSAISGSRN